MGDQIQLEGQSFYAKIQKIVESWNQVNDTKDALLMVMGKISDGIKRPKTSDFFVWLLNYDFPETILLITKEKIVFAVSPKKKRMLEVMETPMDYKGPQLEILVRDIKQDNTPEVIDKLLGYVRGKPAKIGIFLKDQEDGDLTQHVLKAVDDKKFQKVDMKDFMDRMNMNKIEAEIQNLKTAANFVKWTFENVVREVEDIIEIEKQVKHEAIQKKVEGYLENENKIQKLVNENPGLKHTLLDYQIPILIQSGGNFSLNKFNAQSDSNKLSFEVVYINVCGKYKDMNVMASRTLLVNPKDYQKKAYQIAYEAIGVIAKNLVIGRPIKDAYTAGKSFIQEKDAHLAEKLHSNFGFGIGCSIKEENLMINETNENLVLANMSFHVRVTMTDVDPKPARSAIAIGETILINSEGHPVILTSGIQRKFGEISYTLDLEEEEKVNESKGKDQEQKRSAKKDLITESRLRSKNVNDHKESEQRKKSQEQLLNKKLEELKERFENGEITTTVKKEKVRKAENIQSYQNEQQVPRGIKPGLLFVDKNHDTILVPINQNSFVPFHISTIKNVSQTQEGQWTYLRLNFHVPGGSAIQFPPMQQPNALFVKELTLKNVAKGGENHLVNAFKSIKDMLKKAKDFESGEGQAQNEAQNQQEDLILTKGKRESLENLVIRPNIVGKKTVGNLEIHQNGVRFSSIKGHNVDIVFSNIKHAFFQPCAENELIVIVHFTLKTPIQIGARKVTDVQFFKEAGIAADDLDMSRARRRLNDMDELEQEQREREQKIKLNNKFSQFVKMIEQVAERGRHSIQFDIPFDELGFEGCPFKSVVKIRPTKNCLIAISEFPPFVIDINDIEVVHFERIAFGIKNYDMAIIFKDFTTFKRINSIPIEYLEDIKNYLDEIGIIYSESVIPMNWNNILAQIREDFQAFLDEGGWKFLQDEDEEGEEDEEEEEDEEFSVASEEDYDYSSESDYSDEDEDFQSSEESEEELSEEGLSWEELDKRAEEEDRRAAVRRSGGGREIPSKQQMNKRKPAGRR